MNENNIDYEDFTINLNMHSCTGFEKYTSCYIIEDCITKYNTTNILILITGMFLYN